MNCTYILYFYMFFCAALAVKCNWSRNKLPLMPSQAEYSFLSNKLWVSLQLKLTFKKYYMESSSCNVMIYRKEAD